MRSWFTYRFYCAVAIILVAVCLWLDESRMRHRTLPSSLVTYVISLDRTPGRFANVSAQLAQAGVPHQKFSAIDGYLLGFQEADDGRVYSAKEFLAGVLDKSSEIHLNSPLRVIFDGHPDASFVVDPALVNGAKTKYLGTLSLGELGCYYSHRAVWLKFLESGMDYAMILEDDVILLDNFKSNLADVLANIPKGAEIISLECGVFLGNDNLGHRGRINRITGNTVVGIRPETQLCLGTYGYVITPAGARKLLAMTRATGMPLDTRIHEARAAFKLALYVPHRRILRCRTSESEILNMGRRHVSARG